MSIPGFYKIDEKKTCLSFLNTFRLEIVVHKENDFRSFRTRETYFKMVWAVDEHVTNCTFPEQERVSYTPTNHAVYIFPANIGWQY